MELEHEYGQFTYQVAGKVQDFLGRLVKIVASCDVRVLGIQA